MSKLGDAIAFAFEKHDGAFRKGIKQPYICHPVEVMLNAMQITNDEDILCAAVLHDTVEDAGATREEIESKFGKRVAEIVLNESEDKRNQVNKSGTWEIRKQESIDLLKNTKDIGSKIVCLADKVSNVRSIHLLYLTENEKCWDYFNMKDPKKHYWYYSEIAKALIELKDTSLYKEYLFLIDSTFNRYL